jgi:hypothetical protein
MLLVSHRADFNLFFNICLKKERKKLTAIGVFLIFAPNIKNRLDYIFNKPNNKKP